MTKVKAFFCKHWIKFVVPILGLIYGVCIAHLIFMPSLVLAVASIGCFLSILWLCLLGAQIEKTEYEVLKAKVEITKMYTELLEKTNEYLNGYHETMLDNVAIYSQMASFGVEAPVANAIISFSQELGPEHTVILIGIDHTGSEWSVRVAGRTIYLSQLKAILDLANQHFDKIAKSHGALIVKKETSVIN